jgi:hypothetical protein
MRKVRLVLSKGSRGELHLPCPKRSTVTYRKKALLTSSAAHFASGCPCVLPRPSQVQRHLTSLSPSDALSTSQVGQPDFFYCSHDEEDSESPFCLVVVVAQILTRSIVAENGRCGDADHQEATQAKEGGLADRKHHLSSYAHALMLDPPQPEVNPELQVEASPVAPILPVELKAVHPIVPESKPSLAGRSKKGDRKTTRFDPTAKVLPSSPPSPGRRVTSPAAPPAASTQIEPPSVVVPPVLVEEATPTDDTIDEQVPTAISEPTSSPSWARFKPSALSSLASPATPSLSICVDVAAPSLQPKASTNPFDAYSTSGFGAACIPAPRQGYKSYTNAFGGDDAPSFVDVAAESSRDCDVSEGFGLRSYAKSVAMDVVDEDEVILGSECILFTLGATGGWVVIGMGNLEVLGPRDQGEARFGASSPCPLSIMETDDKTESVMEATDPRTQMRLSKIAQNET